MKNKPALILLTNSFPYHSSQFYTEQSFLQVEIQYLAKAFHPIIIAPNLILENKASLPDGVEVDVSYSNAVRKAQMRNHALHLFRTSLFFQEILTHPRFWLRTGVIRDMAVRALIGLATRDWTIDLVHKRGLDPKNTIFYTYWLGNITLGVGMAKQKLPGIHLVSRAHRGDLYDHSRQFNYFPYRQQTLHFLDRLFLISEHGRAYITKAYPWMENLCEVSRLGIRDFNSLNPGSADNVFRIVSCSTLTPTKRVQLLAKGIVKAALEHPEKLFEWNHFGNGPLFDDVRLFASQNLPANVSWGLHGSLPNEDVIRFYRENPVDLFANVSSSEGLPVSIMEVACFGIPVIGTAVGGTPEIVSERNGKLLSSNPSSDEIAEAILFFLGNPEVKVRAGASSRQVWRQSYDADRNYTEFVNCLTDA